MDDYTFENLKGTKLRQYLLNSDILNSYPSLKESVKEAGLFIPNEQPLYTMNNNINRHAIGDRLSIFYNYIYEYNLLFMIHEIINTVIENEDPTDIEYIIIFNLAVTHNDHTSIDMILSNGFNMNVIRKNHDYTSIDMILLNDFIE